MKYDIVILDCHEIECPKVLTFVFGEMCEAFTRLGFSVKTVNNVYDLKDNNIVFMGNTIHCENPCNLLKSIAPNAIYIAWYWTDYINELKYFINTYENMLNIEYNKNRVEYLRNLRQTMYNTPLLLRANEDPNLIGTYQKNIERDYCYMGWKYWYDSNPSDNYTGLYHGVINHSDYFDYQKRKEIYLSSTFALGFQCKDNVYSQHVSQRIFEGLAYGCIVLTNSIPACEQLDNIPVYISCQYDIEEKIDFYKSNPDLLEQKKQKGYDYVKKWGTNHYSIQQYIDIIKNKFGIDVINKN